MAAETVSSDPLGPTPSGRPKRAGTLLVFGIVVAAIFVIWGVSSTKRFRDATFKNPGATGSLAAPGFNPNPCTFDKMRPLDYSTANPPEIRIPLRSGCYGDRYILPRAWKTYSAHKSQGTGDYATVWCNNHPLPEEIRYSYQDMGATLNHCHTAGESSLNFLIQGQGELILTRTSVWDSGPVFHF